MFDLLHPWALLLLLFIPFFCLKKKGFEILSILRAVVFAFLILALAFPIVYLEKAGGKVVYLLDRSRSTGLAVDPSQFPSKKGVESTMYFFGDEHGTDLGKALSEAAAMIPQGQGKIVLLSDGMDTEGGLEEGINACLRQGIKVDTIPVTPPWKDSAITLYGPKFAFMDQAFLLKVKIHTAEKGEEEFSLKLDGLEILHEAKELEAGDNFFTYYLSFREGGIHKVEGDLARGDIFLENNHYELFMEVKERKGILLVSSQPSRDTFSQFLEKQGFPFELIDPQEFPEEPHILSLYDAVVLLDVDAGELNDAQINALSSFVRFSGGGLLAIGGGHSFTLGNYFRSALEELLPVLSAPQLEKEIPEMALIFVIDNSSSMWKISQGVQKLDLAEEVAIHASAPLREFDQVGVIFFADQPQWALPLGAGRNFTQIKEKISLRGPGGGTNAYLALQEAYRSLESTEASLKHVILISDGKSSEGDFENLIRQGREGGVYTTAIAVGADADTDFMKRIAQLGEGKFAQVTGGEGIPNVIFPPSAEKSGKKVEEGRFQSEYNPAPVPLPPENLPPLDGYLKTRLKEKAYSIYQFSGGEPLLAFWNQGQGRVVCWTSDFQGPYTRELSGWTGFSDFWFALLNWLAAPQKDLPFFAEPRGSSLEFRAYSDQDEPLILTLEGPEGKVAHFQVRKSGENQFREEIALWGRGAYILNAFQGEKKFIQAFWVPDPEVQEIRLNSSVLDSVCALTGGKTREEVSSEILADLPFVLREFSLREWLLVLAAVLYLLEIYLSRRFKFSKKSGKI